MQYKKPFDSDKHDSASFIESNPFPHVASITTWFSSDKDKDDNDKDDDDGDDKNGDGNRCDTDERIVDLPFLSIIWSKRVW
jgi:hypothetical protein